MRVLQFIKDTILEYLYEYVLFFAKAITFIATAVILLVAVVAIVSKQKTKNGELEIIDLSEKLKNTKNLLEESLLNEVQLKARDKKLKKETKAQSKIEKANVKNGIEEAHQSNLYVVDFKGSIDAKEVSSLREEVTAILSIATAQDEVFIRLESGGGMVHGYGLAASQLQRIKDKNIPLTISVDKVAASGGYMMACIADKLISAPFAILGSIGVIAQIPNFNKVLKKHDIEFEQLTAGEYKRTLTMFGENDELGRDKFKQELQETHDLFKDFVGKFRPQLDMDKVATGEHWYGSQALDLNLVDTIQTSDDYLLEQSETRHIAQIKYSQKKKLGERLGKSASIGIEHSLLKLMQANLHRFF